jgi:hypothetical protein
MLPISSVSSKSPFGSLLTTWPAPTAAEVRAREATATIGRTSERNGLRMKNPLRIERV